jgi:hypothetical protein
LRRVHVHITPWTKMDLRSIHYSKSFLVVTAGANADWWSPISKIIVEDDPSSIWDITILSSIFGPYWGKELSSCCESSFWSVWQHLKEVLMIAKHPGKRRIGYRLPTSGRSRARSDDCSICGLQSLPELNTATDVVGTHYSHQTYLQRGRLSRRRLLVAVNICTLYLYHHVSYHYLICGCFGSIP